MSRRKQSTAQAAADGMRFACVLVGLVIGAWAAESLMESNPELAWVGWAAGLVLIGACVMRAFRQSET